MSVAGRAYAAVYDWVVGRVDRRGAREHRRRLVEEAAGETLEVAAGTGVNLPLYRDASRVVGLEPDAAMRARAQGAARRAAVPVEVADGDALRLPFADGSFDTVVFSLGLCTIPDPRRALAEAARVLRGGGTLRFYEHVRAADPRRARWQDRLAGAWRLIGRGCRPNQDTVGLVEAAGFRVTSLDAFDVDAVPPVVRPHVLGVAEAPGEDVRGDRERPI